MKSSPFSTTLLLLVATSSAALADVAPTSRADVLGALNRENVQAATSEALVEDGGDPAALTLAERALRGKISVLNDLVYQSNAELADDSGRGDFVWFPSVVGTATYKLSELVSFEGRAALQAGLYSDFNDLDFWGVSTELLARRQLGAGWSVYAGAGAFDYQSLDSGDDLSQAISPTAGVSYGRYYVATRTYGFADVGVKHLYTDPSADERDEVSVSFGASQQLADQLYLQGFYEYRFANYEEGDRHDQRHYVSLSFIYVVCENARASLGVSFVDNDSTANGGGYQSFNTGLGSSLSWDF